MITYVVLNCMEFLGCCRVQSLSTPSVFLVLWRLDIELPGLPCMEQKG